MNSFPLDEQMNMKSVVDYFQEMYGYTIKYPHLPCLQVGSSSKANYMPMEVSYAFELNQIIVLVLLWFFPWRIHVNVASGMQDS